MVILGIIYDCFANIIPGGIRRGLDYGFFNAKDLRLHLVEVERRPAGWFFAYREIHVGYYIYTIIYMVEWTYWYYWYLQCTGAGRYVQVDRWMDG